jgi:hypothetical protein
VLSSLFVASRHARYTVQMVSMSDPLVISVVHSCSVYQTPGGLFVFAALTPQFLVVSCFLGCMSGLYQDVASH